MLFIILSFIVFESCIYSFCDRLSFFWSDIYYLRHKSLIPNMLISFFIYLFDCLNLMLYHKLSTHSYYTLLIFYFYFFFIFFYVFILLLFLGFDWSHCICTRVLKSLRTYILGRIISVNINYWWILFIGIQFFIHGNIIKPYIFLKF